jgi:beta-glucosidase/6-phospho-beta-glucosidase/beta-galactosidase
VKAPGIKDADQPYQCAHTIIKSHAKAYRLYESTYQPTQQGKCGITLDCGWYEPANATIVGDVEAAERAIQFKVSERAEAVSDSLVHNNGTVFFSSMDGTEVPLSSESTRML